MLRTVYAWTLGSVSTIFWVSLSLAVSVFDNSGAWSHRCMVLWARTNLWLMATRVETALDVRCSRCTEFFSTRIEDSSFLRAFEIAPGAETVDVTPDLREAILLHLPAFPLCRVDCAGLCPYCGVDRSRETCECEAPQVDKRWGELDSLNLEPAENEE